MLRLLNGLLHRLLRPRGVGHEDCSLTMQYGKHSSSERLQFVLLRLPPEWNVSESFKLVPVDHDAGRICDAVE